MLCPLCNHEHDRPGDWCVSCGAYLGLLKRQPRRIRTGVLASIGLGAGMVLTIAWHVFSPLLHGSRLGHPGRWDWGALLVGALLLALGLSARACLSRSARQPVPVPAPPSKPPLELRKVG